MKVELITTEDLKIFKQDLITEIKEILKSEKNSSEKSPWLRSAEVRELMKISQGTLQNLRVNGTLDYSMVGKTLYYKREDILNLLQHKFSKQ